VRADSFKNMDATIVTRMLEAGATITGRAACENMCHSATSSSSATGPVHNPFARGYSSGGSSSGCGVLVANGDVDMAIGADQGGSIRVVCMLTLAIIPLADTLYIARWLVWYIWSEANFWTGPLHRLCIVSVPDIVFGSEVLLMTRNL